MLLRLTFSTSGKLVDSVNPASIYDKKLRHSDVTKLCVQFGSKRNHNGWAHGESEVLSIQRIVSNQELFSPSKRSNMLRELACLQLVSLKTEIH